LIDIQTQIQVGMCRHLGWELVQKSAMVLKLLRFAISGGWMPGRMKLNYLVRGLGQCNPNRRSDVKTLETLQPQKSMLLWPE
jgi:hypothetical protein